MSLDDIAELMHLMRWSRDELCKRLDVSRNTVDRWFSIKQEQRRRPSPQDCDLMRGWLSEARRQAIQRWTAEEELHKSPAAATG
jgi:transcriptional regulator with XRE-family HTH domain